MRGACEINRDAKAVQFTTGYCWKLRHTQCNRSHGIMVLGATDRLSCIEAYDVSDDLSKFYFSGESPFLGAFAWPCLFRP